MGRGSLAKAGRALEGGLADRTTTAGRRGGLAMTLPFQFFRQACEGWAVIWSGLDILFCRLPLPADALGDARSNTPGTTDQKALLGRTLDGPHLILCEGYWRKDPEKLAHAAAAPRLPVCYGCFVDAPEQEKRTVWVVRSPYSYAFSPQGKNDWAGPPPPGTKGVPPAQWYRNLYQGRTRKLLHPYGWKGWRLTPANLNTVDFEMVPDIGRAFGIRDHCHLSSRAVPSEHQGMPTRHQRVGQLCRDGSHGRSLLSCSLHLRGPWL